MVVNYLFTLYISRMVFICYLCSICTAKLFLLFRKITKVLPQVSHAAALIRIYMEEVLG